ncbi:hypothetical protein B0H10DRAFT_1939126 [Mycena sp. CBHHK59/15]|nr:hypothetical protein B0H10DRAFT_1939126 [Mycena sp. CBHHK59/15]
MTRDLSLHVNTRKWLRAEVALFERRPVHVHCGSCAPGLRADCPMPLAPRLTLDRIPTAHLVQRGSGNTASQSRALSPSTVDAMAPHDSSSELHTQPAHQSRSRPTPDTHFAEHFARHRTTDQARGSRSTCTPDGRLGHAQGSALRTHSRVMAHASAAVKRVCADHVPLGSCHHGNGHDELDSRGTNEMCPKTTPAPLSKTWPMSLTWTQQCACSRAQRSSSSTHSKPTDSEQDDAADWIQDHDGLNSTTLGCFAAPTPYNATQGPH